MHISRPRRVAVLSVHTSPLAQPGTGDAGGMNVYVLQSAIQLAKRGVEVEIFTRATSSADAPVVDAAPGVRVRNIAAGPFEGWTRRICRLNCVPSSQEFCGRKRATSPGTTA